MNTDNKTDRKGILLAGGHGTRLAPMTRAVSKQLLPVYDKPLIYYPLTSLIDAGCREVLILALPAQLPLFKELLGDGTQFGIKIEYMAQPVPAGIAQALILAQDWLDGASVMLALGDNIIFGSAVERALKKGFNASGGAGLFAYQVSDPERYGVFVFNDAGTVVDLVEKPSVPPSSWACAGVYFFDENASRNAASLKPSARGELEITDLGRIYMAQGKCEIEKLSDDCVWLDAGRPEALLEAAQWVHALQARIGKPVGSPHVAAFKRGLLSSEGLKRAAQDLKGTELGKMMAEIAS